VNVSGNIEVGLHIHNECKQLMWLWYWPPGGCKS
jgi:hypothetical protein